MNSVRIGIIGMGRIGTHYAEYLLRGQMAGATLTAVCRDKSGHYQKLGLKTFDRPEDLIASGLVDLVLIATPHYQHAPLGIAALKAGLHVIVEKPIAAHKADAERLIAAHKEHPQQLFGAMFQMRTESRYREIKKLLDTRQLGEITRFSWIATAWFRSESYYTSDNWRGTWKGEGGGVLINQSMHQLDLLQWLLGMPARVRGFVQLGRFHNIEVEDSVTAYMEFPNAATGVFVTNSGEAPGTDRLEIAGTMGKVVLENDTLLFTRNAVSTVEQIKTATLVDDKPDSTTTRIPIPPQADSRAALLQNFIDALRTGAPLISPGQEGLYSIELANAITYGGLTNQTIDLPLDSAAYEAKLNQLIAETDH